MKFTPGVEKTYYKHTVKKLSKQIFIKESFDSANGSY